MRGPQAKVLSELVLTELANARKFDIMGETGVAALLGFERQKQLMGCGDDTSSCLAEISGALGARYLFVGALGLLGISLRMDFKILDTQTAKVIGRQGAVVESEEALIPEAKRLLERLVAQMAGGGLGAAPARPVPLASWIAGGAGLAVGLGGAVMLGVANGFNKRREELTFDEALAARAQAQTQQTIGLVALGAGIAAVGAGAVMYFVLPDQKTKKVSLHLAPRPDGALAVLTVAP